nr:putative reverse transcriptase domain-containing protein [Tanacetum cinerariifolium]
MVINEVPSSSIGQCKAVFAKEDALMMKHFLMKLTSSREYLSLLMMYKLLRKKIGFQRESCHASTTKELYPGSFTLPCPIGSLNLYAMENLGASINSMLKLMFEHLKLTNLKKTDMLVEMADMTKKAPVGMVENVLVKIDKFLFPFDFIIMDMLGEPNETMILDTIMFDLDGNVHHYQIPIEKVYRTNFISSEESFNLLEQRHDLFSYESFEPEVEHRDFAKILDLGPITSRWHICKPIRVFYNNECGKDYGMWPTCDPNLNLCNGGSTVYRKEEHRMIEQWIIMPPRESKKKKIKKLMEKHVAKAIKKYEKARANCYKKIVRIPLPNSETLEIQGERPEKDSKFLSCIKTDEKKPEDIRIIHDFPEEFLDDLSGLPPVFEIEFRIDLIPSSLPVVKSPYQLAPSEMIELSNQLKSCDGCQEERRCLENVY